MSEFVPIFAETKRNKMKTQSYSTQFVSVRGKLQIRFLKSGREYRSKLTTTPCTPEELTAPNALLDATISALTAKIKTALWQAELTNSDPYKLLYPDENPTLLPNPPKYFEDAAKRDPKLRNFCGYIARNLEWEELTDRFLEDYKDDLKADDYSDNTIRAYLTGVRVALSKARRDGAEFPSKDFTEILNGKIGTSVGVYLTKSEVEAFSRVETESDVEEAVKIKFLIGAYSGARFSDYSQLSSANVVSVEYPNAEGGVDIVKHLSYVSVKTSTHTSVPLKPIVLELLGKSVVNCTVQQVNRILPILAKRAGINAIVSVVHGDVTTEGEKWKFVRSHSARKSFASAVYMSGEYDIRDLSRFLGHADVKTTMGYITCPSVRRNGVIVSYFD